MSLNNLLSSFQGMSLEEKTQPFLEAFLGNAQQGIQGAHKLLQDTIEVVEEGKLLKLDALLGDQACQVRTVFIGCLYKEYKSNVVVQEQYRQLKEKAKNQENYNVPESLLRLAQCFLLTYTKEFKEGKRLCDCCKTSVKCFREQTEEKKLLKTYFSGCSVSFVKGLVSRAKKAIVDAGILFLQQKAEVVSPPMIQKMLSSENIKTIQGRRELPCIYSLKMMLEIAQAEHIPILIKVKKTAHLLEQEPNDPFDVEIFGLPISSEITESSPVMVIEGMRKERDDETKDAYIAKLASYTLLELCELNAAQHSQYSDKTSIDGVPLLNEFSEEKTRLQELSTKAKQIGCSEENMDLFCITHIFCDTFTFQPNAKEGKLLCLASK